MDEWIADNLLGLFLVFLAAVFMFWAGIVAGHSDGFREGFKDGIGYCVPTKGN